MANEISSSNWSETDNSNQQQPPNGWPEGQAPSTINDCARMMMGALKRFWNRANGAYASTGSSNAYVLTPDVALGAYVTGERLTFRANFANTGSATLNVSSLGAKTIKKMTGAGKTDLDSGDIQSGQSVTVEYDGTDLVMVTPIASSGVPTGFVGPFAGSTAPTGWLLCSGQAVSRSTYAALFTAIGTTFGAGDGSTTFNVPDLRGRVPAGFDPGNATGRLSGVTAQTPGANALGNAGGEQTHTLTTAEMPTHGHGVNDPGHSHPLTGYFSSPENQIVGQGGTFSQNGSTGAAVTGISIQANGGGGAHNNVQPTIILNYIIRT